MNEAQTAEPLQEGDYEIHEVPATSNTMAFMTAEIDVQIATAKRYPRSLTEFKLTALSLATASVEVAESCQYGIPRGGKIITGPSVRLAEILADSYGNLRIGGRIVSNDGRRVTAQGVAFDLQKNVAYAIEVTRSIMQNVWETRNGKRVKTGKLEPMNEDMQIMIGNAAISIALRNAIFKVVPKAHWNEIYVKVQEIIRGTETTLPERRKNALAFFVGKGVKEPDIFRVLGVKGLDDVDLDKLAMLSAMKASLVNKEVSLDALFPPPTPSQKAGAAVKKTEEKLEKSGNGAKDTAGQMEDEIK